MRNIGVFLLLIFVASCSSRKLTLEEYAKQQVKFDQQKVSYPTNDFTLYIPENWVWKVEKYDNEHIILGIDASSPPSKEGFIDLISIQKVKSFGGVKDLKSEYNYLLNLAKNQSNKMKLVESGETEILKQKAYYIHSKSASNKVGESEMISFVLASPSEGIFYYITAGSSQTDDLMKNMSIIIQSIKTFEINKID